MKLFLIYAIPKVVYSCTDIPLTIWKMEEETNNPNPVSPNPVPPNPTTTPVSQNEPPAPPPTPTSSTSAPAPAPVEGVKASLGRILKTAFLMYFKNPFLFSGIYAAVMLPVAIINGFLLVGVMASIMFALNQGDFGSVIGLGGLFLLLSIIISFIAGVLTLGGTIRATDNLFEGKKAGLGESILFAFKKAWAYFVLGLRVFWYVISWVLLAGILFAIITAIVNTMMSGGSSFAETFTAYAQLISPHDTPGEIAMTSDFSSPKLMTMGIMGIMTILFNIVLIVIVAIRSLKSMFSFYILFDEENIKSGDALKKSLALTKGSLFRMIGYGIVISIIVGAVSYILMYLIGMVTGMISDGTVFTITTLLLNLIHGAIIFPIPVIFFFLFYKALSQEKDLPKTTPEPTPVPKTV